MRILALRSWPTGANLLSAGVYPLRGHLVLIVWAGTRRPLTLHLPLRAREYA